METASWIILLVMWCLFGAGFFIAWRLEGVWPSKDLKKDIIGFITIGPLCWVILGVLGIYIYVTRWMRKEVNHGQSIHNRK